MNDLEMTIKCAQAMGWTVKPAEIGPDRWRVYDTNGDPIMGIGDLWIIGRYKPLEDDAQALALVKKFRITLEPDCDFWWAWMHGKEGQAGSTVNAAIVKCVAMMETGSDSAISKAE